MSGWRWAFVVAAVSVPAAVVALGYQVYRWRVGPTGAALTTAIRGGSERDRVRALRLVVRRREASPDQRAAVFAAMESANPDDVRCAAGRAATVIDPAAALEVILDAVPTAGPGVWHDYNHLLCVLPDPSGKIPEALRGWLASDDAEVRYRALVVVRFQGARARALVPTITQMASSRSETKDNQFAAVRALLAVLVDSYESLEAAKTAEPRVSAVVIAGCSVPPDVAWRHSRAELSSSRENAP